MNPLVLFALSLMSAEPTKVVSHPPLRVAPPPANRARVAGPAYFVDATKGQDEDAGTEDRPWRTIARALRQVKAGDTVYLRGGVFHEAVYVAVVGRPDAPITIRSFPGEQAVLDAGWREFRESPATAWEPFDGGGPGEFRSVQSFPNLRSVLGSFGDSQIGLQTYYHAQDLRATNEIVDWLNWERTAESDLKPLYCGPGVWHDRETGRIHVRLAHTHLPAPSPNYTGETDPRRVPLGLAPFHATPLTIDSAEHVRFQDLIVRGSGYVSIQIDQAVGIEFDNVTVWCGAYGLRVSGTRQLRFIRSGFYGNVAPWTFRSDGSKRDYPGRPHRNLSRLNTHAIVEMEAGRESSVYATPQNDHWEFSHSEFTDAHDAVYLGGVNVKFHHNLVENMQDDGLYLSPMYLRHRLDMTNPRIEVYQNLFRGVLTTFAFGGSEPTTHDQVFLYRNVIDLRDPIPAGRPSLRAPTPSISYGKLIGDHGSPPWPAISLYHNTVISREGCRDAAMGAIGSNRAGHPRRTFNNLFLHLAKLPGFLPPSPTDDVVEDGNLYWSPLADGKQLGSLFAKFRQSEDFKRSQTIYPPGSSQNSLAVDPQIVKLGESPRDADYRLSPQSPAIGAGIELPIGHSDPLSKGGRPDIGAVPSGGRWEKVGR